MELNELPNQVIGYAIKVHRGLDQGLLELTYEQCFWPLRTLRVLRGETILYLYKSLGAWLFLISYPLETTKSQRDQGMCPWYSAP